MIKIYNSLTNKLEEFKTLLIDFYETANDAEIIDFMKKFCVKRVYR